MPRSEAQLHSLSCRCHALLGCTGGASSCPCSKPPESLSGSRWRLPQWRHVARCWSGPGRSRADDAFRFTGHSLRQAEYRAGEPRRFVRRHGDRRNPHAPCTHFDRSGTRRVSSATDERVRHLLERTEALDEDARLALHGTFRAAGPVKGHGASDRCRFRLGDPVVLRPRPGGDVFDIALIGEAATIASIEEDFEGRIHYAVTVDADPGRDLGELRTTKPPASSSPGRRDGARTATAMKNPRILIAGIGNIFPRGRRLRRRRRAGAPRKRTLPEGVKSSWTPVFAVSI